jgi:hypothetical protein
MPYVRAFPKSLEQQNCQRFTGLDEDLLVSMQIEQVINMPTNGLAFIFMKASAQGLARQYPFVA